MMYLYHPEKCLKYSDNIFNLFKQHSATKTTPTHTYVSNCEWECKKHGVQSKKTASFEL